MHSFSLSLSLPFSICSFNQAGNVRLARRRGPASRDIRSRRHQTETATSAQTPPPSPHTRLRVCFASVRFLFRPPHTIDDNLTFVLANLARSLSLTQPSASNNETGPGKKPVRKQKRAATIQVALAQSILRQILYICHSRRLCKSTLAKRTLRLYSPLCQAPIVLPLFLLPSLSFFLSIALTASRQFVFALPRR